jgi:hypothetical protein
MWEFYLLSDPAEGANDAHRLLISWGRAGLPFPYPAVWIGLYRKMEGKEETEGEVVKKRKKQGIRCREREVRGRKEVEEGR